MSQSDDTLTAVTTIHGNRYRLGPELGRGGQGTVYAIEGGRLAVKVLRDRSARARECLRDQLAMVGRLPLEDLAVARPIEQLRPPDVGYVMELFTGMVPLRNLLKPSRQAASLARWYIDSGGLRRRLRLLARLAEVFAELHARGLVYVDPSPQNVFVSADADALELRLIDTDNMCSSGAVGRTLYTPGYGAPELVRETGLPSTLSDAHAFAVMASETLTLAHPLLGDVVRDGAPELEDRALAGELPWTGHEHDSSNHSSDGIPRDIVLSRALRQLFSATFEAGLNTPTARPGLSRWAAHLHRAADRTLLCPGCHGSYYYDRTCCPWCDASRPTFLVAAACIWDPARLRNGRSGVVETSAGLLREASGKLRVVDAVAISLHESAWLSERVTHGTNGATPCLRIMITDDRLTLENREKQPWRLLSTDGQRTRLLADQPVELALRDDKVEWTVHTGADDRLHRVIRFDLRRGPTR